MNITKIEMMKILNPINFISLYVLFQNLRIKNNRYRILQFTKKLFLKFKIQFFKLKVQKCTIFKN